MEAQILITDDHSMIRKGLKIYLQVNLGNKDVDETSSCTELLNALKRKKYTHLILDIILADGSTLEVIPTIRNLYPDLKILIFSMQSPEVYGEALKQYGIFNYLPKSAGDDEILLVLNRFLQNEKDVSPKNRAANNLNPFTLLSPRELEVLHYLLKGIGTKQVSEQLNLQMNTVSTLKNRILAKTKSPNMKHLMDLAAMYNINY
jgi:two-component system, NarL family, invasion response regulator UvrY